MDSGKCVGGPRGHEPATDTRANTGATFNLYDFYTLLAMENRAGNEFFERLAIPARMPGNYSVSGAALSTSWLVDDAPSLKTAGAEPGRRSLAYNDPSFSQESDRTL